MSFTTEDGSTITLAQGRTLTSAYRSQYPNTTRGVFIGAEHISKLLSQNDAIGIRTYFGRNANGENTVVLVAADSNGNDILDLIIDNGTRTPPGSCASNDLNC